MLQKVIPIVIGISFIGAVLLGCSNKADYSYPKSDRDKREEKMGSIINNSSSDGGFALFGGRSKSGSNQGNNVNQYLWRAALDVVSFMPLQSSDSNGGVIITDWYEDPQTPGERYKLNVLITSSELNAAGVKVRVFKQVLRKTGDWQDTQISAAYGAEIEDKIINRARNLNISK